MARTPNRDRRVVIVAYEGVQVLDVSGPHEVFAGVSRLLAQRRPPAPGYDVRVAATTAGPIVSESGLALVAEALEVEGPVDTLVVPGGHGVFAAMEDDALVGAVAACWPDGPGAWSACAAGRSCSPRPASSAADGDHPLGEGPSPGRRAPGRDRRRGSDLDPRRQRVDVRRRDRRHGPRTGARRGRRRRRGRADRARWLVMFLRRPGTQSQFAAPVWRRPAHEAGAPGPGPHRRRPRRRPPPRRPRRRGRPQRPPPAAALQRRLGR